MVGAEAAIGAEFAEQDKEHHLSNAALRSARFTALGAVGAPEPVAARNLDRLTDDGFRGPGRRPGTRDGRRPSVSGRTGCPSEHRQPGAPEDFPVRAVRNITDDRRSAKPAILRTIDVVRTGYLAVGLERTAPSWCPGVL
ncbi:hypothetical protein GCM10010383_72200 [Streptomyces lomondensis]|uniref:Uncharacterized protein n=1 Tax=Streptomyces lomondensis TaxID=68229 RepID=A0ABQ2XT50_9ACTN|nr:hypothetical protein GCM10010383_72200 [Streptomyces lomondensis]